MGVGAEVGTFPKLDVLAREYGELNVSFVSTIGFGSAQNHEPWEG